AVRGRYGARAKHVGFHLGRRPRNGRRTDDRRYRLRQRLAWRED
ncbi:putative outer membrane receptor domain protein, partial [Vibrio parahaemolyticus AQ3810]